MAEMFFSLFPLIKIFCLAASCAGFILVGCKYTMIFNLYKSNEQIICLYLSFSVSIKYANIFTFEPFLDTMKYLGWHD